MEDLNSTALRLLFEKEIYLIKEVAPSPSGEAVLPKEKINPNHLTLKFKGGNSKGIILIINVKSHEFTTNEDEVLLINILKAIGLSINDVAIINQHHSGTEWREKIPFNKVVAFGINPSEYIFSAKKYTTHSEKNSSWLFSDTLSQLAKDKVLKGKLWGELKKMF